MWCTKKTCARKSNLKHRNRREVQKLAILILVEWPLQKINTGDLGKDRWNQCERMRMNALYTTDDDLLCYKEFYHIVCFCCGFFHFEKPFYIDSRGHEPFFKFSR